MVEESIHRLVLVNQKGEIGLKKALQHELWACTTLE